MIGASNREDMIDPAILRPGRLDVKIKIERPDAESAQDIFSKYLTEELPINADDLAEFGGDRALSIKAMIEKVVDRMYAEIDDNRFLEVTYANGDKEVMYFKDFNSGAMIQNIVDRAKKNAIKSVLETGQRACASSTSSIRSLTSSPRTRTCPTRPIPMTGRVSRARRASGSSTSAHWSPARRQCSRAIDTESNLGSTSNRTSASVLPLARGEVPPVCYWTRPQKPTLCARSLPARGLTLPLNDRPGKTTHCLRESVHARRAASVRRLVPGRGLSWCKHARSR